MMGDGGSSSQLIFFIAATVVAMGAVGVMTSVIYDFNGSIAARGKAMQETMTTDIRVINDPANVPAVKVGPTWKMTLYVKNIGGRTLDPSTLTVFYDGAYAPHTSPTYPGGEAEWLPGAVLQITVDVGATEPKGDHSFRVVSDGGRAHDFKFNRK